MMDFTEQRFMAKFMPCLRCGHRLPPHEVMYGVVGEYCPKCGGLCPIKPHTRLSKLNDILREMKKHMIYGSVSE